MTGHLDAAAETATRGAQLLDKRVPGWAQRINLPALDMNSCNDCVLGQLYGDYGVGVDELGLTQPALIGFDLGAGNCDYPALDAAWTTEIMARREATR